MRCARSFVFFFFQAEDGIRDLYVTGVQTCALPIFWVVAMVSALEADVVEVLEAEPADEPRPRAAQRPGVPHQRARRIAMPRSEERRVGKEGRSRWWPRDETKNSAWQQN